MNLPDKMSSIFELSIVSSSISLIYSYALYFCMSLTKILNYPKLETPLSNDKIEKSAELHILKVAATFGLETM